MPPNSGLKAGRAWGDGWQLSERQAQEGVGSGGIKEGLGGVRSGLDVQMFRNADRQASCTATPGVLVWIWVTLQGLGVQEGRAHQCGRMDGAKERQYDAHGFCLFLTPPFPSRLPRSSSIPFLPSWEEPLYPPR